MARFAIWSADFSKRDFPPTRRAPKPSCCSGAAQILWLEVPDHAAVDLSVRLAQADRRAARYAGLVNAVLRRVAQGATAQAGDVSRDTPEWLLEALEQDLRRATPRARSRRPIGHEPALDLTVKNDAAILGRAAARPRAADRHRAHAGARRDLAAAGIFAKAPGGCRTPPPRCRRACSAMCAGTTVADLCAAPGGKTAQLALAGAHVTAVDRSPARLNRLRENLARLCLEVETVAADALEWQAEPFDAVLLDAPCSSTGTIRRHPDVPWLKTEADLSALTSLQQRLLDRAVDMLKPGGTLVYCVCSLEPEEGEDQIAALLARDPRVDAKAGYAAGRLRPPRIRHRRWRPAHVADAPA